MRRKLIGILKGFVFFLPFIIATFGFLMELQDGILNAMYRAMRLYMVEMDCEYADVNILIEIARWTAPVMSAAAILAALSSAFGWMRNFVRVRRKGAVAIHGDSENAASLADSLGKRAVLGEKSVNRVAPNQVLMFREDREMLDYLNANREKLFRHDNKVYLCTEHLVRSNFSNRNLIVCNYPEICARYYWKEHPLRYHSGERTIVLIGFGGYGQEILTQALLRNVYAPDSRITYHVFGDASQYLGCHAELSQIVSLGEDGQGDRVCFHQEPWFSCGDVISCADRIILAQDEEVDNLMTMNLLERYYLTGAIHIKVNDSRNLKDFSNAVIAFGTAEQIYTEETILGEESLLDAKRIHAVYYRQYQCPRKEPCKENDQCLACSHVQDSWYSQTAFVHHSNVAQADHIPVKMQILLGDDFRSIENAGQQAAGVFDSLSEQERFRLLETEHLRWMRYHFMNNWRYAPVRNNDRKQHPLLVPFGQLELKDQLKDESAWRNAFLLYRP